MYYPTELLAAAHQDDLRREAERLRHLAALRADRRGQPARSLPVTIRRATAEDEGVMARLAALDSAQVPRAPALLAEQEGELRAALSLSNGVAVADPAHPSRAILDLLVTAAAHELADRRMLLRRWRLRAIRRRATRHTDSAAPPGIALST
jgi:hypothetical protein